MLFIYPNAINMKTSMWELNKQKIWSLDEESYMFFFVFFYVYFREHVKIKNKLAFLTDMYVQYRVGLLCIAWFTLHPHLYALFIQYLKV